MESSKTYEQLLEENEGLRWRLEEATETITAIRTGQVDALVVKEKDGEHQLFTLKTADQSYRVFIEKMNEGAVTLNEEGLVLYCNSMFASLVNMPLSKVIGRHFDFFIAQTDKDKYRDIFRRGWTTDSKTELNIRNGERLVPCQLSAASLHLDEGPSLIIILTDLTFQKEIQRLLKESNKSLEEINAELETSNHELQQFASIASHDLQEPLRKILIFSTMLRDKQQHELSENSLSFLSKIIASSQRMRTMINDILSYSRLPGNTDEFEITSLSGVVAEVLDDYEILISEKKATIIIGTLPEAEVNRGQIRQVFQNLISNSLKFSRPDVPLVIEITSRETPLPEVMSKTDGFVRTCSIEISDNGIGFDELYNKKIFALFQRLNTKDKYEGSGIGLAIAKKIMDRHNGTISASGKEGSGARFTITLPLRRSGR